MADIIPRKQESRRGNLAARRNDPVGHMQTMFDTLFDRLLGQWGGPFSSTFGPLMRSGENGQMRLWDFRVEDHENEVVVRAELPGFDPDDIDLRVEDNFLTISAEKRREGEGEEDFRSFFRSVSLPTGADADKVQANYRNGLLEVHIPRSEAARPRRIRVQGEQGTTAQSTVQQPQKAEQADTQTGTQAPEKGQTKS